MKGTAALMALLALVPAAACGGSGAGADTLEDAGLRFLAAASAGDEPALRALFPTQELVVATFGCAGGVDPFEGIGRDTADIARQLDDLEGLELAAVSLDAETVDRKRFAQASEPIAGCVLTADLDIATADFLFTAHAARGGTRTIRQRMKLMQLDGRWYVVGFD